MSKLSKNILDQIKKEKVKPKSRYYFIALHTAIWIAVILTIIFGSLGIAVVIRHLTLTDWELAREISSNPITFMPLLWFGIIALAIFIADQIFKRTKKGYRFKISHVVIASLLLSVTLGSGLYMVEADQSFEGIIRDKIKPYQQWEDHRAAKFVMPHLGVLAGEITEINEDWMVVDFSGKEWRVDISKARISPGFEPLVGKRVGMKGERINKEEFQAHHIKEFEDAREQHRKNAERRERMKHAIKQNIPEKEAGDSRQEREKMEYERKSQ